MTEAYKGWYGQELGLPEVTYEYPEVNYTEASCLEASTLRPAT